MPLVKKQAANDHDTNVLEGKRLLDKIREGKRICGLADVSLDIARETEEIFIMERKQQKFHI